MEDHNLFQMLGQVSGGEAAQVFPSHLRGFVFKMICDVMASEVDELCGPKHQPTGDELYRAGSSSGRVLVDGQREEVSRPRVRERQTNGSTSKVTLASYASASNPEELQASILSALMARGFHCNHCLLAVLDGSDVLRSVVKEFFLIA